MRLQIDADGDQVSPSERFCSERIEILDREMKNVIAQEA